MTKIINFLGLSLLLLGATAFGMDNPDKRLFDAAVSGNLDEAQISIKRGALIEAKDVSGTTPLIWAAWTGHEAVCRLLIANKASIEAKNNNGWTPLNRAAWNGNEAVCRLLIENKASIEAKDCMGQTPLIVAANNAPLIVAANNGKEAVCRLLIDVQLASARKNKAAIVTLLGIVRNRRQRLPCHMHYDVAKIIDRQVFGIVMQQMQPVIEQITEIRNPKTRGKWLAYVKQQMNLAYDMPIDASMPDSNSMP
jgi:hypothetical protein